MVKTRNAIISWGIIVFYVGVLYWMSRFAWQNTHFPWFLAFLIIMPAMILMVFRFLKLKD